MNLISIEKAKEVCRIGQGNKCCRYLACGMDGLECLKDTSLARVLNARANAGVITARGDNCKGGLSYEN